MRAAAPLTALTLALASAVPAGAMEVDSFSGTYALDGEASDDVAEAFEPAVQEMNVVMRTLARRYLRRGAAEPEESLSIAHADGVITMRSGNRSAVSSPVSGEPVPHETSRGDVIEVSTRLDGDALRVRLASEEGDYVVVYRLEADGQRLVGETTVDLDRLPKTVRYRLVYVRADD